MADTAGAAEPGGDGIRTLPLPAEPGVRGAGTRTGPQGEGHARHSGATVHRVHRIDVHGVMLFTDGPVRHMIDFAGCEAAAGEPLRIRPGQIHRFLRASEYRGGVLAMQPGFPPRTTVEAAGLHRRGPPPRCGPDPAQLDAPHTAPARLRRGYENTAGPAAEPAHRGPRTRPHGVPAASGPSRGRLRGGGTAGRPTPLSPGSVTPPGRASPPTTTSAPARSAAPAAPWPRGPRRRRETRENHRRTRRPGGRTPPRPRRS